MGIRVWRWNERETGMCGQNLGYCKVLQVKSKTESITNQIRKCGQSETHRWNTLKWMRGWEGRTQIWECEWHCFINIMIHVRLSIKPAPWSPQAQGNREWFQNHMLHNDKNWCLELVNLFILLMMHNQIYQWKRLMTVRDLQLEMSGTEQ